jgi:hypothetical protein
VGFDNRDLSMKVRTAQEERLGTPTPVLCKDAWDSSGLDQEKGGERAHSGWRAYTCLIGVTKHGGDSHGPGLSRVSSMTQF